jgi:hypothetical protein
VSDALASLPWVEQGSIKADRSSRTVVFGINDKDQFNMDEVSEALGARYRKGVEVVKGPEPTAVEKPTTASQPASKAAPVSSN